jgi:hypothetical protein
LFKAHDAELLPTLFTQARAAALGNVFMDCDLIREDRAIESFRSPSSQP